MEKDFGFTGSSPKGKITEKKFSSENKPADLPENYGDTKIVAMVRDPLWIHVYWEVQEKKLKDLKSMLGDSFQECTRALRVHDVTDIDFNGENSISYFDIQVEPFSSSWYINTGNPNRDFIVDLGILTPSGQFILIARSNKIKTPRAGISQNIDQQWMMVEEKFSKILQMSGSENIGQGSSQVMGEITKRLFSEMNLSSDVVSSMGSKSLQDEKSDQEGFWFKVGTELIVYGETVPSATVKINDEEIKLREDGSFTLRYELPDGKQNFEIKALSENRKHERKAEIDVEKKTK
ncbi:MAG: DUF4912 domain-containing protein [Candidatus Muiribacteriota bacterium]